MYSYEWIELGHNLARSLNTKNQQTEFNLKLEPQNPAHWRRFFIDTQTDTTKGWNVSSLVCFWFFTFFHSLNICIPSLSSPLSLSSFFVLLLFLKFFFFFFYSLTIRLFLFLMFLLQLCSFLFLYFFPFILSRLSLWISLLSLLLLFSFIY